jgi:hypothetical protein
MAIDDPDEYISIMIKRMDKSPTIPELHIMGVRSHGTGGAYIFNTRTEWASCAHLHVECLSRVLGDIGWNTLATKTLFLQLDNIIGEKKNDNNNSLFAWLALLIQRGIIKEVTLCMWLSCLNYHL